MSKVQGLLDNHRTKNKDSNDARIIRTRRGFGDHRAGLFLFGRCCRDVNSNLAAVGRMSVGNCEHQRPQAFRFAFGLDFD